ncbi:MAG: TSUP family transporter [Austwickia sp.]|nr:TSUP family transporter [Austwickia sp.]MBK8437022.1 TSUP family transporter [Austwickia sp.]MBK9100648.1 TSUP family transporter [Austwickia sp.]
MDDPSLLTLALLATAGLLAGWVDAVVGGGGLIQLPALLLAFPGALPVQLLGTNKLASICGTATAAATYLRRIPVDLRTALPLAAAAFAGSAAGAVLASRLPMRWFSPIVLIALILVGGYTLRRPDLGVTTGLRYAGRRHLGVAALIGAGIGCYDGALGPGTGSFLVIALVAGVGYSFLQASALAKTANVATNLAALAVFVPQGAVSWRIGLVMGVANLAGGYLGARTAVAAGQRFVRAVFLVVVSGFTIRIGYDVLRQLIG